MKENKYCKYNINFNNVTEVYSAIWDQQQTGIYNVTKCASVLLIHFTASTTLTQEFSQIFSAVYAPAQSGELPPLTLHICMLRVIGDCTEVHDAQSFP
jgi:hypothetical protein